MKLVDGANKNKDILILSNFPHDVEKSFLAFKTPKKNWAKYSKLIQVMKINEKVAVFKKMCHVIENFTIPIEWFCQNLVSGSDAYCSEWVVPFFA